MFEKFVTLLTSIILFCSSNALATGGELGNERFDDSKGLPVSFAHPACENRWSGSDYIESLNPRKVELKSFLEFLDEVLPPLKKKIEEKLTASFFCETNKDLNTTFPLTQNEKPRMALWVENGAGRRDLLMIDKKRMYKRTVLPSMRAAVLVKEVLHPLFVEEYAKNLNAFEFVKSDTINQLHEVYVVWKRRGHIPQKLFSPLFQSLYNYKFVTRNMGYYLYHLCSQNNNTQCELAFKIFRSLYSNTYIQDLNIFFKPYSNGAYDYVSLDVTSILKIIELAKQYYPHALEKGLDRLPVFYYTNTKPEEAYQLGQTLKEYGLLKGSTETLYVSYIYNAHLALINKGNISEANHLDSLMKQLNPEYNVVSYIETWTKYFMSIDTITIKIINFANYFDQHPNYKRAFSDQLAKYKAYSADYARHTKITNNYYALIYLVGKQADDFVKNFKEFFQSPHFKWPEFKKTLKSMSDQKYQQWKKLLQEEELWPRETFTPDFFNTYSD